MKNRYIAEIKTEGSAITETNVIDRKTLTRYFIDGRTKPTTIDAELWYRFPLIPNQNNHKFITEGQFCCFTFLGEQRF